MIHRNVVAIVAWCLSGCAIQPGAQNEGAETSSSLLVTPPELLPGTLGAGEQGAKQSVRETPQQAALGLLGAAGNDAPGRSATNPDPAPWVPIFSTAEGTNGAATSGSGACAAAGPDRVAPPGCQVPTQSGGGESPSTPR